MTIDKLARMTADQFSWVDVRFNAVDKRFDAMDKRFDQMDSKLQTILDVVLDIPSKKAFERWENKVEQIDVRLMAVERKVKVIGK